MMAGNAHASTTSLKGHLDHKAGYSQFPSQTARRPTVHPPATPSRKSTKGHSISSPTLTAEKGTLLPTDELRELNIGFEPKIVPGMISRALRRGSESIRNPQSELDELDGEGIRGQEIEEEKEKSGEGLGGASGKGGLDPSLGRTAGGGKRPGMPREEKTWDEAAEPMGPEGLDEWA